MPPETPAHQTAEAARQTLLSDPAEGGKPLLTRVLYVDDEPDLLELGKIFLEQKANFLSLR